MSQTDPSGVVGVPNSPHGALGMRPTDRFVATVMHATARWSVRYGDELRFAGRDLPRPRRRLVPTRHGRVPVHVYADPAWEADTLPRPVYVHLHGGAWLMRHPFMDDFWCRYLVATAGVAVVNVDFRTGPYVAYPVAQEQAHDVLAWLTGEQSRHGTVLGVDGTRLAVGGLSSGGGMAAAVCLMARDGGTARPRLQVLGVPALDLASDVPTGGTGAGGTGGGAMISPSLRGLVRRVYFPDPAGRAEPYASPVLAPDLTGLPPAVVLTAEHDSLRADGDTYAVRLAEAGVPVLLHDVTPGAGHYFLSHDLDRARLLMAQVAQVVREQLVVDR